MIKTALAISFVLVAVAMAITFWRLLRGPDAPDRILALDTLYINAVAVAVLIGISFDTPMYFEAALAIALMGFVGTVALAKFLLRGDVVD
jgi:multicomponent K+:H+ antiporter subunit F